MQIILNIDSNYNLTQGYLLAETDKEQERLEKMLEEIAEQFKKRAQ